MTLNDALLALLSVMAGAVLGTVFFVGLWWTVKRTLTVSQPGLLVLASMLGRTGLVVGGFYLVSDGSWQRVLFCLVGFLVARLVVTLLLPKQDSAAVPAQEAQQHAP
ncbi:MAG: ATP synthase subunit I [Devosia sp.]